MTPHPLMFTWAELIVTLAVIAERFDIFNWRCNIVEHTRNNVNKDDFLMFHMYICRHTGFRASHFPPEFHLWRWSLLATEVPLRLFGTVL